MEHPAGEYVLTTTTSHQQGVAYFRGDLVYADGQEATRLVNAGALVDPDSDTGKRLLNGEDFHVPTPQRQSAEPIVHKPPDRVQATPQPQQEQAAYRPEDDSEALERMYNNGPDWAAIRGRQNEKLPKRGPKPDEPAK